MKLSQGYDYLKQKSTLISSTISEIAELLEENDAALLKKRAKDIEQGIFKIMVLGEFKNGKSTLLNAMLGSKTLPAKSTPCTAVITMLVYGDKSDVCVYEKGKDTPRVLEWGNFVNEFKLTQKDQETIENGQLIDRFKDISYVQLECKNELCSNGVRLIDSPGLKEHASRTKITTDYLNESQAIILVLNATRILTQDEKDFIKNNLTNGKKRLTHLFFVINRINQIEEEEAAGIRDWVKITLEPYFLKENGEFDEELYNSRIFFVNAKGALNIRQNIAKAYKEINDEIGKNGLDKNESNENTLNKEVDSQLNLGLEATGVPALERELENFLTSNEKIRAAIESTIHVVEPIVISALNKIELEKLAVDKPLEKLEESRREAEKSLGELETEKHKLERNITIFCDVIKNKVYSSLVSYINEMKNDWDRDSGAINLEEVSLKNLIISSISKEDKDQAVHKIENEIRRYAQQKLNKWAEDVLEKGLKDDIEKVVSDINEQIGYFELELDKIAAKFAKGSEEDIYNLIHEKGDLNLLTLFMGNNDIKDLAKGINNTDAIVNVITSVIKQAAVVFVVFTVFGGPMAWLVLIGVEGINIFMQQNRLREGILNDIGDRLFEEFEKNLPQMKTEIFTSIEEQFNNYSRRIINFMDQQLNETREKQEQIIRLKREGNLNAEMEKQRLTSMYGRIEELFGRLN